MAYLSRNSMTQLNMHDCVHAFVRQMTKWSCVGQGMSSLACPSEDSSRRTDMKPTLSRRPDAENGAWHVRPWHLATIT